MATEVGIDQVFDHIEEVLRDTFPALKGQALEDLGQALREDVLAQMSTAQLHDQGGRLREWQSYHVGSHKGYVAVRPVGSAEGAKTGPNGPGAITNYVESGHAVRRARQGRSRARMMAVPGYHFYAAVARRAEAAGSERIRALAEELVRRLEEG